MLVLKTEGFLIQETVIYEQRMSDKHNLIVTEDTATVTGDHTLLPYVPKCSDTQSTLHLWSSALVTGI